MVYVIMAMTHDVNAQADENDLGYAQKAMVVHGHLLITNGKWEGRRLKPKVERKKH